MELKSFSSKPPVSSVVPSIIDLLERETVTSPIVPVSCHGTPVGPAHTRNTKNTKSIIEGFDKEIRPAQRRANWRPFDVLWNPAGRLSSNGRHGISLASAPPDIRQLAPCDCVSDLRLSM
ncbi:unnamed protein product [Nippostrongylus brasiliensis]|uniref:Uncharacterized protein n=1 Tax=Nippostrongylus brasiliensis TaxID=27835 RepID=A0A0N4YTN7_NIPBR|nr:unnamed protein product [Nippostrongylus brasiliensis]